MSWPGCMTGEGLIRLIDGALFPTPQWTILPTRVWGLFELLLGLLLFATRRCRWRAGLPGRVVASLACGFLVAMAVALYITPRRPQRSSIYRSL